MAVRFRVSRRASFADGHGFDKTGAYEALSGRALFAVDPLASENAAVVDIENAPRNAAGLVEFEADFWILKPVDMARGNRRIFFDYGNRGNKRALQFYNDAAPTNNPSTLADAGNGFLMRHGYTVVWLGWQGDLRPGSGRMVLDVPVATDNGRPIEGDVRVEFVSPDPKTTVFPLGTTITIPGYAPADLDSAEATLTRRRYTDSPREPIARDAWSFARIETGISVENDYETSVLPSDGHIYLPSGFEPGWIYELVYKAKDPLVLGLGHVAVRDFMSFLRFDETDADAVRNPLRENGVRIEKAYSWGRSQAGRCIRDFVYLGFNAANGRGRIFDGVLPHVSGAGKMWMNHRFANAVVVSGMEYENHYTPVDMFPFSYASSEDRFSGRADAILKRPDTDPLVIHTDTATEYWARRGSLVVTDTNGADLPQPDTVRVYMWSSSQHFSSPKDEAPKRQHTEYFENIVATSMFFRANLVLMDEWASGISVPPPSRHPKREDGTLVSHAEWKTQFPHIPGIVVPRGPSRLELLDFGPEFERGIISEHPPKQIDQKEYPLGIPAVDGNGNDVAGVRAPMVQAPLGTYVGWNIRRRGQGFGAMAGLKGSYFPFADTIEEQVHSADTRACVEALYDAADNYVEAIRQAALRLVQDRFMLEEDVERAVSQAAGWGAPRHVVSLPGGRRDRQQK